MNQKVLRRFPHVSFIMFSLMASVGVWHSRHFPGVPFTRTQIAFILLFESAASWVSRDKYLCAWLVTFSTEPSYRDACGSQNQVSVPRQYFSLRQAQKSKPRPKVIERRTGWGRSSITFISLLMKSVELRSLLRNRTANRVFRSTSKMTFIVPCERSKIIRSQTHSQKVSRSPTPSSTRTSAVPTLRPPRTSI